MQTTTRRPVAASRHGFLRRMLSRGATRPSPVQPEDAGGAIAADVIDRRDDLPATQWRRAVSGRLERLEAGMALVAETMKRAFAQVHRSIEEVREEGSDPHGGLERVLDESLASLRTAVEDLSEAVHRVPYILAAAADDITAQLEAASAGAGEDQAIPPFIPSPESPAPAELLPATPFELEPVEEQFVPMDEDSDPVAARRIWGLEA